MRFDEALPHPTKMPSRIIAMRARCRHASFELSLGYLLQHNALPPPTVSAGGNAALRVAAYAIVVGGYQYRSATTSWLPVDTYGVDTV